MWAHQVRKNGSLCLLREMPYLKSKCYNSLAPAFLPIYSFQDTIPHYSTRKRDQINLSSVKSSYGHHSFSFLGVSLWHSPPSSIRASNSLASFTNSASDFMHKLTFYTINVYMMIFDLLHSIFVLLPIYPTGAVDPLFPILPCYLLCISDEGIVEEEGG